MANTFILFILLAVLILIPVMVGVYVYRDAKSRGLNAPLWTLVAIITPSLIGLIIYLLVRGGINLQCPICQATVKEEFTVCPVCGAKLKGSCPNCNYSVEDTWKVCPHCAGELNMVETYTPPLRKSDKKLGVILALVIIVPLLFLVVVFVLNIPGGSSNMGTSVISTHTQKDSFSDSEEIMSWLDECDRDTSKIYALHYTSEQDDTITTTYLVYFPSYESPNINTGTSRGLFTENLEVEFSDDGIGSENANIVAASVQTNKHMGLTVTCNGEKVDYELTEAQKSPVIFGFDTEPVEVIK